MPFNDVVIPFVLFYNYIVTLMCVTFFLFRTQFFHSFFLYSSECYLSYSEPTIWLKHSLKTLASHCTIKPLKSGFVHSLASTE